MLDEVTQGLDAEKESALEEFGRIAARLIFVQVSYFGNHDSPFDITLKQSHFGEAFDRTHAVKRVKLLNEIIKRTTEALELEDTQTATFTRRSQHARDMDHAGKDPKAFEYRVWNTMNDLLLDE